MTYPHTIFYFPPFIYSLSKSVPIFEKLKFLEHERLINTNFQISAYLAMISKLLCHFHKGSSWDRKILLTVFTKTEISGFRCGNYFTKKCKGDVKCYIFKQYRNIITQISMRYLHKSKRKIIDKRSFNSYSCIPCVDF